MTVTRLARAAAVVALFGLLSRLLGFAREIVLAAAYGTSAATDAFVNSLLIVNSVAAVLLYTIQGGGHTWPGSIDVARLGRTTQSINATDLIWEFFQGHEVGR